MIAIQDGDVTGKTQRSTGHETGTDWRSFSRGFKTRPKERKWEEPRIWDTNVLTFTLDTYEVEPTKQTADKVKNNIHLKTATSVQVTPSWHADITNAPRSTNKRSSQQIVKIRCWTSTTDSVVKQTKEI